jgi:hypothetical protein
MVTNVQTFLFQSEIEKDPETIQARKLFYQADTARMSGKHTKAIQIYEKVLGSQDKPGLWARILKNRGRFLAHERTSEHVLEETYEHQARYLRLLKEDKGEELKRGTLMLFNIGMVARPSLVPALLLEEKAPESFAKIEPLPLPGPFDGFRDDGKLWVPEHIKMRVLRNMGLIKAAKQGTPPQQGTPPRS